MKKFVLFVAMTFGFAAIAKASFGPSSCLWLDTVGLNLDLQYSAIRPSKF